MRIAQTLDKTHRQGVVDSGHASPTSILPTRPCATMFQFTIGHAGRISSLFVKPSHSRGFLGLCNGDFDALAERFECGFNLVELRTVSQVDQSINLRAMQLQASA